MKTLLLAVALLAQTRIASDFEIERMQKQATSARDFLSQLSAHLNLGDLRRTRNENSLARDEYTTARTIAEKERVASRTASSLSRYATATMYAGLAEAKLGNDGRAFELCEEALRYAADDAKTWNVYASAMKVLNRSRKAASAAQTAVALATDPLDRAVYQYSLAIALTDDREAIRTLEQVVTSLRSSEFESLRKEAARKESFEIYSSARGDEAAYLSLLNRSQLQLALLYEKGGDVARARKVYQDVLASRTDDPTALAALAKMSRTPESFAEAFDANPFSIDLVRDYQAYLQDHKADTEGASSGAQMRRALEQMSRGENLAARGRLDALIAKFPNNDVVQYLAAMNDVALGDFDRARERTIRVASLATEVRNAISSDDAPSLRATLALLARDRATPEQRAEIDRKTFSGVAIFSSAQNGAAGQTIFESGTIDGVPFRFSEPTAFTGSFAASTPLQLTYRILGATELNGASALLIEPLKLEKAR
jgi:tetratricopeptide (TPR) repeat protein